MDYIFKRTETSKAHIESYAKLLSEVFPHSHKFSFDYLDWQYRCNPHGEVVGYDAYLGDELAAHYVTIPVLYEMYGKPVKGLLSLNTASHPKHQGKGLFTQLAKKTYAAGRDASYAFVIGVANQNSSYGFLNKLDFTLIAPLDVKVGLGKIKPLVNSVMVKSLWDKESLNWRLSNPEANYLKKGNEIFCRASSLGIDAQLFSSANHSTLDFEKSKALFKMWVGISNQNNTSGWFVNLPDKLKPSPLNLIFKALNDQVKVPKKEDFFFELIDFDAY